MALFRIVESQTVPTLGAEDYRTINADRLPRFWEDLEGIGGQTGCYVFGIDSGAYYPWYVGKATSSFRQECFAPDKQAIYSRALSRYLRGRPVLFFVIATSDDCGSCLDDVESFLIQNSRARNNGVLNDGPNWSIDGVFRTDALGRAKRLHNFREMMGLPHQH